MSERAKRARFVVDLVIRLFFAFFLVFTLTCRWRVFGPSLNNTLAKKDAPGRTSHRVQFIASKNVVRWSYDRFSDSPFFCFFLVFTLTCRWRFFGPSLNNILAQNDAPGRTSHRVQFIASKNVVRWSYDRFSDSPFFCFFWSSHIGPLFVD